MPNFMRSLLVAAVTLTSSVTFSATSLSTLIPQANHSSTIKEIITSLNTEHYNQIEVNDQLSEALLDNYLKELDPNRHYFLQSDIDSFEPFRNQLDNQLLAGELENPYKIYNLFQIRVNSFLGWAIERLKNDQPFDFNKDETLETDRSHASWPDSEAALKELWRKRIKSALLNLILADKTEQEARQTLVKRYESQRQRLAQSKSEDVFQRFTNVFTQYFDPHTSYFSPRSSENFKINMSLSLEGIGAVLQTENEHTKIVRLVPAGPADKTGQLKASDLITGVGQGKNGEIEDVVGWRLDDVVDKIRGPKGSIVRLEVIPSDASKQTPKLIAIERNTVKLEEQAAQKRIIELEHQGTQHKIGVIDIPAFYIDFNALRNGDKNYKSTTRDVERLIKELQAEKIDGLIIDLRDNSGGSLREANELVGLFIDLGPTVQIRNPNGRVDIMGDFNPKVAYTGPLAVVVNRLSASASEIFAGAIQDYHRGLVIGGQTFGKGTVQTLQPLNHGQLKLTNAKFYRISGESTQHKGVIPDISFPGTYDLEEIGESSLEHALKWDTVSQARHSRYNTYSPALIKELNRRHTQRTENHPDFTYLQEQMRYLQTFKDNAPLPLNKDKLKAKREAAKKWQIDTENRRRLAKGEKPIAKLTDLDKLLKKDSQGIPITAESEAMLQESGYILLDLIELSRSRTAALGS